MKNQYRIRNWSEYNAGLKHRGSITFWLSAERNVCSRAFPLGRSDAIRHRIEEWLIVEKTGKRGASNTYNDIAIATMSTIKSIFSLAGRQAQGFVESVFELMQINLPVPDHSTVSRRLGRLKIKLPVKKKESARHLVIDSTGVKVYGEGEWKTRQHGISKRRTWRKLHLGIDETTGEIISAVATTNDYHDSQVLGDILDRVEDQISQVSTDGAYDTKSCYEQIERKEAKAVIPPRKNAKIQQHGNCQAPRLARDENLRAIRQMGRKKWKRESGYHRRSIAETTMFRLKCIFGGSLSSRQFDNQAVELFLQCAALNRMIQLCKPESYIVAS
ncbi:MAG: IS5 family transposase [Cyanobacteria bacterium P01_C01_bin.72]